MIYEITKGSIEKAFDNLEEVLHSFNSSFVQSNTPIFLRKRIKVEIPEEINKIEFLKKLYSKFRENGIGYKLSNESEFMEELDYINEDNYLKLLQQTNKAPE